MRSLCVVLMFVAVALAAPQPETSTKYNSDKYNNVNLDEILRNKRLLEQYLRCIIKNEKCTSDAAELKEIIPKAVKNECADCTEIQQKAVEKVLKFLYYCEKAKFAQVVDTFDPEKKLVKKYEGELAKTSAPQCK